MSLEYEIFVTANDFAIQLAHFTKEEIGHDNPIYIPSLEEGDN